MVARPARHVSRLQGRKSRPNVSKPSNSRQTGGPADARIRAGSSLRRWAELKSSASVSLERRRGNVAGNALGRLLCMKSVLSNAISWMKVRSRSCVDSKWRRQRSAVTRRQNLADAPTHEYPARLLLVARQRTRTRLVQVHLQGKADGCWWSDSSRQSCCTTRSGEREWTHRSRPCARCCGHPPLSRRQASSSSV